MGCRLNLYRRRSIHTLRSRPNLNPDLDSGSINPSTNLSRLSDCPQHKNSATLSTHTPPPPLPIPSRTVSLSSRVAQPGNQRHESHVTNTKRVTSRHFQQSSTLARRAFHLCIIRLLPVALSTPLRQKYPSPPTLALSNNVDVARPLRTTRRHR